VSGPAPKVYNIEPGTSFVDALARGLLNRITQEHPDDPLALARATVLLPTRRAVRSLREAFLRASDGRALLLPRMMPLGDIDEDDLFMSAGETDQSAMLKDADDALPPVIGGVRRQLILARLVMAFGGHSWALPPDAGQAAELAAELARLLDQMETERLGFEKLGDLVPERFAAHWQATLEFLKIITEYWPDELAEAGAIGPAERRNLLLAAAKTVWCENPPDDWIVAAGSTGSIPATADLLAAVARLEKGCVVLPGLDDGLGDEVWNSLGESHPQYGLARLLDHIGMSRDEVLPFAADWPHGMSSPATLARAGLLSQAMSPQPSARRDDAARSLEGVGLAACPTASDEAGTIALMMRGILEAPGKTAALVTPDRRLARRVAARLRRWDIEVDDSAGTPLANTVVGSFFRLIAEMVADKFAPLSILACLKHPLAAGAIERAAFRDNVRALETSILRGPRPAPGLDGLARRVNVLAEQADAEDRPSLEALGQWVADLKALLAPLIEAMGGGSLSLNALVNAHIKVAEALAASELDEGGKSLWRGDDGEALANFLAEVIESGGAIPPLPGARYPALLSALMVGRVVRPGWGRHPRLFIWGPLEARLQHADLMILGGLNETTWPPDAGNDPWMSRPMRAELGLPLPERRIGLSAHDFAQAFAAPEVMLTRAEREEGAPTVPSRWLAQLENLVPGEAFAGIKARGEAWLQKSIDLITPADGLGKAMEAPAPTPPVAARPRRLSVTEIETLQINPYAVYARRVLKLRRLEDIDADAGAAERGTFTHRVLQKFLEAWPDDLPGADGDSGAVAMALLEIGREVFRPIAATPGLYAFWWPRFERLAHWFADTESARRAHVRPAAAECRGELVLAAPGGPFILNGIADRIDVLAGADGLAIVDYKTGSLPGKRDQEEGFAPQLPLLAAIAEDGGFPGIDPRPVVELAYWRLTGGDPAGEEAPFAADPAQAIAEAVQGLENLIARFDMPEMAYRPRPVAGHEPRFDDYAHLARIQEWASSAEGGGGWEG
jgi:ATP-dependent helicase/nuclease subunit B